MTRLVLPLLLLLSATTARADPAVTPKVDGLELPAPTQVAPGAGFVKLKAQAAGPVVWDVFAVFADPAAKVQFDTAADGTLYVGIPGSPGAIRVCACTVQAGKPSAIASTLITITAPDPQPNPQPEPTPQAVQARGLHVTVVGAPESAGLRKALEAAGCRYWPYPSADDPKLKARADLQAELQRIGSLPALIVQDEAGEVKLSGKLPAGDAAIVAAINAAVKGK